MANFNEAYKLTAAIEGGYVNDPTDRGGETYKGISRKFHPNWSGWDYIDECKSFDAIDPIINDSFIEVDVKEFYKNNYWDKLKGDCYNSQDVANELYDTAVNMGVGTAAKFLQKSINLLARNKIKVDGSIGNITISEANKIANVSILKSLNGFQFMRYADICQRDPSQERFFKGWLRRVEF